MPSMFVDMLLKKSEETAPPTLPELEAAEFSNKPRLEVRKDANGITYVVTLGDKQYSRINMNYFVLVRTFRWGKPNAYWRKMNPLSVTLIAQIDEVIANGGKSVRS
ncbi:hypothetical protein ACVOZ6_003464 [Escherichia coli]